jgi:spore coat polysaccharide biosynthesis predicted glycosyltransferase SpsG
LGLPSIVIVLAENQKNVAGFLLNKKIALVVDFSAIEHELVQCFESATPPVLKSLSERSVQVTAGDGAKRIVQQIIVK